MDFIKLISEVILSTRLFRHILIKTQFCSGKKQFKSLVSKSWLCSSVFNIIMEPLLAHYKLRKDLMLNDLLFGMYGYWLSGGGLLGLEKLYFVIEVYISDNTLHYPCFNQSSSVLLFCIYLVKRQKPLGQATRLQFGS